MEKRKIRIFNIEYSKAEKEKILGYFREVIDEAFLNFLAALNLSTLH